VGRGKKGGLEASSGTFCTRRWRDRAVKQGSLQVCTLGTWYQDCVGGVGGGCGRRLGCPLALGAEVRLEGKDKQAQGF
jgi:hypothetical protein